MNTIFDVWNIPVDIINETYPNLKYLNPVEKYLTVTEYGAAEGEFSEDNRVLINSGSFRSEIINPDITYEEIIPYITNYLSNRQIRDTQCRFSEIENGKLKDGITLEAIEGEPFSVNGRCYTKLTIDKYIVNGGRTDPVTREELSRELVNLVIDNINQNIRNMNIQEIIYYLISLGLIKINLSKRRVVPQELFFPDIIESLDLELCYITSLSGVIFPANCKELYLDNNLITSLEGVVLPNNLAIFSISYNKIISLEGVTLPVTLQICILSHNLLSNINTHFPDNMSILLLSNNRINSIDNIHFPEHLEKLALDYNNISSLNTLILHELLELNCNHNRIESIQEVNFVEHLEKLENLELNFNSIVTISNITFSPQLLLIDLSNNVIDSCIEPILPNTLESLYLNNNRIVNFTNIQLPSDLEILDLSNNAIRSLNGIGLPIELLGLNCKNNRIRSIAGITFPVHLQILDLQYNPISSIEGADISEGTQVILSPRRN